MKAIMKKRALLPDSGRAAAMAVHAASRAISKPKPQIRIIHVFAPEIIKTDVANFRDLVQRLTGKPPPPPADEKVIRSEEVTAVEVASISAAFDRKPESGGGACRRVKEEEEELDDVVAMWNDVVEIEGFFEELGEFPLLPSAPQIMLGFNETQFV